MSDEKPASKALQLAWQGTRRATDSTHKHDKCQVAVVGIGGAGSRIIAQLARNGIRNAETIAIAADSLQLSTSQADQKLLINEKPTRGHPAIDKAQEQIKEVFSRTDIVIITASLDGRTGTKATPEVAGIAKEQGAITIGVVTKPFKSEKGRTRKTFRTLDKLRRNCDTLIVIDNNKLMEITPPLPMAEAFKIADKVVADTIEGFVETISTSNLVTPDPDDFKTVLRRGGVALVGVGESDAPNRAEEAVRNALSNPLLNTNYAEATGALVHVTGDIKMTAEEASRVGEIVTEMMRNDAQVIWGAQVDPRLNGKMRVTLVITGANPPQTLRRHGLLAPQLFNLETGLDPEKNLPVDLGLYQMEGF
jgi:cell division protein FtsZ